MGFLGSFFVAAMLVATQASAEPEAIQFSDLADPLAVAFDDPYKDMGGEMLSELKLLVELDQKLSGSDLDKETRLRLEARRSAAQEKLKANGHNVKQLLEQRWDIAKKRRTALMATNPIFNGVEVSISGYMIPAPEAADGSRFGYLVPQVGMCSHLPPPPTNQLVRVRLRAGNRMPASAYTPVRVSGKLHVEPSDETIFILDGESRMVSGWTLEAEIFVSSEGLGRSGPPVSLGIRSFWRNRAAP